MVRFDRIVSLLLSFRSRSCLTLDLAILLLAHFHVSVPRAPARYYPLVGDEKGKKSAVSQKVQIFKIS